MRIETRIQVRSLASNSASQGFVSAYTVIDEDQLKRLLPALPDPCFAVRLIVVGEAVYVPKDQHPRSQELVYFQEA